MPNIPFRLPAMEAFPTGLSVLDLAGLNDELGQQATSQLRVLEDQFLENVNIEKFLRAKGDRAIRDSFLHSYETAFSYFVASATIVWRALNHDYERLLLLSAISSERLEHLFFENVKKLEHQTFINCVASLRVLAKVAEWVTKKEKIDNKTTPPMDYLNKIALVTFLTWCMVAYITGQVTRARKANIMDISDLIREFAEEMYKDALRDHIPELVNETHEWYWSFEWQEGAVEAELDKRFGRVKRFDSAHALIHDLSEC